MPIREYWTLVTPGVLAHGLVYERRERLGYGLQTTSTRALAWHILPTLSNRSVAGYSAESSHRDEHRRSCGQ